jgi:phosphoribosyl 1,2-cyclic phosphodiesterase
LGHPFPVLWELLPELDAAYLESNYDPEMLQGGPYPERVKAWIRSSGGHLSNHEAAELALSGARCRLQWVAPAHISEHNNSPELAAEVHQRMIGRDFPVYCTSRYGASDWLTVG